MLYNIAVLLFITVFLLKIKYINIYYHINFPSAGSNINQPHISNKVKLILEII